jgi:hypothetical protein
MEYIIHVKNDKSEKRLYFINTIDENILVTTNPEEALTFDSALNYHYTKTSMKLSGVNVGSFELVKKEAPESSIDEESIMDEEEAREAQGGDDTDYERQIMRNLRNGDGDLDGH